MIDRLLSFAAPHHCYGCDKIGTSVCDHCKNDIIIDTNMVCIGCGLLAVKNGLCNECTGLYDKGWVVAAYDGVMERAIKGYKFNSERSLSREFSDLLLATLPVLPDSVIIIPVPTVRAHIRERGFDHIERIAKRFARRTGARYVAPLYRRTTTKQRGASRKVRIEQAKRAFGVSGVIDSSATYLLVDDVVTTGSTIKYAAKALRDAGATTIWVAALARQDSTKTD